MIKGLPLTYNKDLQEDKQALGAASTPRSQCTALFDSLDTVQAALKITSGVLATLQPAAARMRGAQQLPLPLLPAVRGALNSFMLATDLSEYLVRKGVPFRETHHVAGRAVQPAERSCKGRRVAAVHETQHGAHQVQLAEERSCALTELSVADLQSLHPLFGDDAGGAFGFFLACGTASRREQVEAASSASSQLQL
ncbi:hypothetical protein EMIHUDRAFT_105697 [Emiliania huxleyi CCMP1516]|uniref:Argininosuccinate lyase C-terminal domain-containing protein n=2 Tax=Emiliania huxleyi TaxID=2903 RepID=A0A0D3ICH6_EMIH1|nr:hypothetical protein EMIHUDRAFT_105697 [Emiliania huxleyi CCMP1516]EOD08961.1 hypothetical protein EMIHUDRAFT_105697 [Emiliania huxleyi CCMP1516]|eukprot:XP_005761390.1 hypothetical protein EMIHUDRAFT_105697 [Emiliania huxleyi CCMP1516]